MINIENPTCCGEIFEITGYTPPSAPVVFVKSVLRRCPPVNGLPPELPITRYTVFAAAVTCP